MSGSSTTWPTVQQRIQRKPGTRIGYFVAALVNLGVLWFVNQLLTWEWPPFLTSDFEEILPWLNASLVLTIVLSLAWIVRDPPWFRHLGQIAQNVLGLIVAVLTWQVFPFDLSDAWATVARIVLAVGIFGMVVSTIVEVVRLLTPWSEPGAESERRPDEHPGSVSHA